MKKLLLISISIIFLIITAYSQPTGVSNQWKFPSSVGIGNVTIDSALTVLGGGSFSTGLKTGNSFTIKSKTIHNINGTGDTIATNELTRNLVSGRLSISDTTGYKVATKTYVNGQGFLKSSMLGNNGVEFTSNTVRLNGYMANAVSLYGGSNVSFQVACSSLVKLNSFDISGSHENSISLDKANQSITLLSQSGSTSGSKILMDENGLMTLSAWSPTTTDKNQLVVGYTGMVVTLGQSTSNMKVFKAAGNYHSTYQTYSYTDKKYVDSISIVKADSIKGTISATDTTSLSNRINNKLDVSDTTGYQVATKTWVKDNTILSNTISPNTVGYIPASNGLGSYSWINSREISDKFVPNSSIGIFNRASTRSTAVCLAISDNLKYKVEGYSSSTLQVSSDYGETYTAKSSSRTWANSCMSVTGKYQSAVASGGSGSLTVSSDYGSTWADKYTSSDFRCISMSYDGKYQLAALYGSNLYRSNNYGSSWTTVGSSLNWTTCGVSGDGKYMVAAGNSTRIYLSTDSGATFNPVGPASSYVWMTGELGISGDGKYITISTVSNSPSDYLYTSPDYGVNWNLYGTYGSGVGFNSIRIDKTGKYQVIKNYIALGYSSDYGATFTGGGGLAFGGNGNCLDMTSDGSLSITQVTAAGDAGEYILKNKLISYSPIGFGTTPTAMVHIAASRYGSVAGNGQLKMDPSALMATPESGLIENDGTTLYYTNSSAARSAVVLPAYGSLYYGSTTLSASLGTESTTNSTTTWDFKKIDNASLSSGALLLTTTDPTNGNITISTGGGGKYLVTYHLSFYSDLSVGYDVAIAVLIGSTAQTNSIVRTSVLSTEYNYPKSLSGSCEITLSAANTVSLAVATSSSGNGVVTIKSMGLSITRIGM